MKPVAQNITQIVNTGSASAIIDESKLGKFCADTKKYNRAHSDKSDKHSDSLPQCSRWTASVSVSFEDDDGENDDSVEQDDADDNG